MILRAALLLALSVGAAAAQGTSVRTEIAPGAVLRTLDKVSGTVTDVEVFNGQTLGYGPLQLTLTECRYPAANPTGDAFAHMVIVDTRAQADLFRGWMMASSPALNALDHARYDVWVLRCMTS